MDTKQRFESCVTRAGSDSCWMWTRKPNANGYGYIKVKNKKVLAHRLSYQLHVGEIPDGMIICHSCDTPLCVNPDHLFLGTHAINVADKVAKGRQTIGERNSRAKLTDEAVAAIRVLVGKFGIKRSAIAKSLKLSKTTITYAINHTTWRHI